MSEAVEILAKLIGFDTTSSKPNRALIDYIRNYLDGYGVKSEVVAGKENGKACLFATIGPGGEGGVVLAGHTDTVPVEGQNWTSDPFTLTERGENLYGRGTCDMKGFIACVLAIVPELVEQSSRAPTMPVHLAFTHDEETNMSGAARLSDYMRAQGLKPAWVWIGEPTLHKIIDSHKGVAKFITDITGVPAHSAKPDLGLNALELGQDFMSVLRAVAAEKRAKPFAHSPYDPPFTTVNPGIVSGGTAENIIAEHWKLIWQTREHPGDDHQAMLADIERRAQEKLKPKISPFLAAHPHVGCKTCAEYVIPPLMPTKDNAGEKVLGGLTGLKAEAVSFATEGGFFQKLGGAVVVCGPGSIDQAHKADEFVAKSELSDCIDLLRRALLPSRGPQL